MPVSLCAEPRAACVCRYCLSTSTVCLASPSCLLREGAVVLPADAIVWVIPLPCPSPGAILQSHVVLKGKRWVSFVGDIWISENFVPFLRRQLADRSLKMVVIPFHLCQLERVCPSSVGQYLCHWKNQRHAIVSFPWSSFARLGTQLLAAFTASVKGMVHILCHGCLASIFLEL